MTNNRQLLIPLLAFIGISCASSAPQVATSTPPAPTAAAQQAQTPASQSNSALPVAIGQPAPDFTVTAMDGKQVKLSSLRGKPVLLDFWATWCGPCRMSLPHTQKVAAAHGKQITVLAISNEEADKISSFVKQNEYTFSPYRDPDNTVIGSYKVESIPTFVVIDAKGNLVDYETGYRGDAPLNAALAKVGIKV